MSPRRTNVMLLSHNNKKVRYNVAVGKMQRINGINTVNLRKEQKIKKSIEEHNRALDELNLAMKRNDLEIDKIQLKGMMRRHGLTRGEEQKIKKIQSYIKMQI
jgi:histidyl-tRNA synthetase